MLAKTSVVFPKYTQDFYHDRSMLHEVMTDVASEGPLAKESLTLLIKLFKADAKAVVFFVKMGLLSNLLKKYEQEITLMPLLQAAETSEHWKALVTHS
jgi:hypothetical protein